MTQDEIIEMAIAAGITPWTKHEYIGNNNFSASDEGVDGDLASLIQFFQLATAKEREACAKLCESEGIRIDASYMTCAEAIRARGEA